MSEVRTATDTIRGGLRLDFYWLFLLPLTFILLAFYIYPVGRVLAISFTEPAVGLGNYERLLTSSAIHNILITTARVCAETTLVTLFLAYIVAYAMVQAGERHRLIMFLFILVPFWISVLIRAFSWVILLRPDGVVNTLLLGTGLVAQPLELVRNELGVVIGMVHYMLPIAILPLYANLRGIDANLVLAARGLGASPWTAFFKVFLPLSLPGVIGAGVLVFIFSLGFFVTPAILGGGKTIMIAEYVSLQILTLARWGVGAMLSAVLLMIVIVMLAAVSRVVDVGKVFGAR